MAEISLKEPSDLWWQEIPGLKDVPESDFLSWKWQLKKSYKSLPKIEEALKGKVPTEFFADVQDALQKVPMNIRITPYIFSLIDWKRPYEDPLRLQFLPVGSQLLPDHPECMSDSLAEDVDSPVPLLTHRYPDKVLFLPLATCPVYCSYCTRSRIIGGSTESKKKSTYGARPKAWEPAFKYIESNPHIKDVVISGGDSYLLQPKQIRDIGERLLAIPHIKRFRYATKGLAIGPMKIMSDPDWLDELTYVNVMAKQKGVEVAIHTHFSHPNEITGITRDAAQILFKRGITVRNQAVLQKGVNDSKSTMHKLTCWLADLNIRPYYVYMHDMVPGCEHLRTTLSKAIEIEQDLIGRTAGFNVPKFVCDLPGGGGKRPVTSFMKYENGVSEWEAPGVRPGHIFKYYDPLQGKNIS